jgi:hypothetical protein
MRWRFALRQQLCPIHQRFLGRHERMAVTIVAKTFIGRLKRLEGQKVGLFVRRVHAFRRSTQDRPLLRPLWWSIVAEQIFAVPVIASISVVGTLPPASYAATMMMQPK